MVFISAASSSHYAFETLTLEEKTCYKDKIYSITGLSLNPITKKSSKIVEHLLAKDRKEKKDIVIWHDVLNKSVSRHDSNNFQALAVSQLIDVLKGFQNKLSALV